MNNYNLNKGLFNNIEISDEMKEELFENCKNGKRTADVRFKHAGALTALLIAALVGGTGVGATAYYQSVMKRMESMPQEEVKEYVQDINNDFSVTISGSWSRQLTNDESLRLAELERKYYGENLFPEQEVQHVKTLSEWDGKSVCYVEEDNLLHLPDAEMSNDQLLMFIDYSAKKDYVIEKEAEKIEPEEEVASPYVDVEDISEDELIERGREYLVKFLGKDLGNEWHARVEAFKPSESDPSVGLTHDSYTIYWEQEGATPNSTDYVVGFGMHKLDFRFVAVRGREHWATLKSYTKEEALKKGESDEAKVFKQLHEMFGLPEEPDVVKKVEAYQDYSEGDDCRQIRYIFKYGDNPVDILWDLADEKLASVEICGNMDLGYELGDFDE
ncbi:MAG: hypothetical protein K6G76_03760 [Lachnospiraceae bacterium]|nr:hypothetical protein [Lachnospiraceae bacterium]